MTYLRFDKKPRPRGMKTDIIEVWTGGKDFEEGGPSFAELGVIRWFAPWRRYVFYPGEGTLFDAGCLGEMQAKLRQLMAERKPAARGDEEERDG